MSGFITPPDIKYPYVCVIKAFISFAHSISNWKRIVKKNNKEQKRSKQERNQLRLALIHNEKIILSCAFIFHNQAAFIFNNSISYTRYAGFNNDNIKFLHPVSH